MSAPKIIENLTAPLTQPSTALESSRDSGYDLASSVGEIVDNSIEARATWVRIATVEGQDGSAIVKMAFADNGAGIELTDLPKVLSLGFSSRYNSRVSLGRFGMGLKLASLAQSRSVEVYTRQLDSERIYCTSLDLDAVREGEQVELTVRELTDFPEEFAYLMGTPEGEAFKSGTLVVWGDIDRLPNGAQRSGRNKTSKYEQSLATRRHELTKFLARAYRRFLAGGFAIELDGRVIELYDPTFMLPSPRMIRQFGEDLRGEVVQETTMDIDGHEVHIRVTLAPPETRLVKGEGAKDFKELYLGEDPNNAVSMLRHGREIYYALIPQMYPTDKTVGSSNVDIDRFIGVEVSFPAALDELFQVRNVKRGAEPVDQLRTMIRKFVQNPIKDARDRIRDEWKAKVKEKAAPTDRGHEWALDAAAKVQPTMPIAPARPELTDRDVEEALFELAEDVGIDPNDPADEPAMAELTKRFHERSLMIADRGWPGKDMMSIRHLSGKAILTLNKRHPFIRDVYEVVKEAAAKDANELDTAEVKRLLTRVDVALDVLFMAYAQAENMHPQADEVYGSLRSYWGVMAAALVQEGVADL